MKVCAVIVTYGDRFHLLKQVMDACFRERVNKIIVVDNASEQNSRKQLKDYEQKNKDRLKVIYLDENTGSAGGYKRGLEEAYKCEDCEFIWLLDDDNKPLSGSLSMLLSFWKDFPYSNKEESIALLCYRKNREEYILSIERNNPWIVVGRKNSFLGFHFLDLINKIRKRFYHPSKDKIMQHGVVAVAPYGGLFFHKNLIKKIGLPDSKIFHTGMDDYDFTIRITKIGGKIILLPYVEIEDLDESWQVKVMKKSRLSVPIIDSDNEFRVEHSIKNSIFFYRKHLLDNKIIYKFNKYLYIFLLALYSLFRGKITKVKKIYNLIQKYEREYNEKAESSNGNR